MFWTVGAAKAAGVRIAARCPTCGGWKDQVDYDRIIAAKGRDFSLVDRRARCTFSPGCPGLVKFHYLNGVVRPLWTDEAAARWIREDEARRRRQA